MLDGVHTCFDRFPRRLVAVTMHRHFFAQTMRLIDQRRHFRRRELRSIHFIGEGEHATRDRGFNYIRAVLDFESNRFANFVGTIGDPFTWLRFASEKLVAITAGRIEMATSRADAFGRYKHVRARSDSVINRIAQRNIDKFRTASETAAEIAYRRKPRLERRARIRNRHQRHL